MRASLVVVLVAAFVTTTESALECRQPNWVTKEGKIYAVDPESSTETEVLLKGVGWSGMEKDQMVPDGLWGTEEQSDRGVTGTKLSSVQEFMSTNSFNSVRLFLAADYTVNNKPPQLGAVHLYENKELIKGLNPATATYIDVVGRLAQTFQDKKITVLLDIQVLAGNQDAYWYPEKSYKAINDTQLYQAVTMLAQNLCNASYWNIIGIDLKNAMTQVMWNKADDADPKKDWKSAAEALANQVTSLCPQWLVFVGGASSPTKFQEFKLEGYEQSIPYWDGGNLVNATENPLKVATTNKIVFVPQAFSHGGYPQAYFYTPESNCSADAEGFEGEAADSQCVDFVDGKLQESKTPCEVRSTFGCKSYQYVTSEVLTQQYSKVMGGAIGSVLKQAQTPVVLLFGGAYGADYQPQQTLAIDFLVNFAATQGLSGAYFLNLNPDNVYYLEGASNKKNGIFGKTHYGLMKIKSWQEPNQDLLETLSKLPSSKIPCYGEKGSSATTMTMNFSMMVISMILSVWMVL